jgi:hypothetical protein
MTMTAEESLARIRGALRIVENGTVEENDRRILNEIQWLRECRMMAQHALDARDGSPHPYTITFVTLGHQRFCAKTARLSRDPEERWVTYVEAYTAADALTQFEIGHHGLDFGPGRSHMRHATYVMESIDPGYPRCRDGHPQERGVGTPRGCLLCPTCKSSTMYPRSLGEVR